MAVCQCHQIGDILGKNTFQSKLQLTLSHVGCQVFHPFPQQSGVSLRGASEAAPDVGSVVAAVVDPAVAAAVVAAAVG